MSHPEPTISVLLPVRDAAHTLPATLRSIARQSYPHWECRVVDDGSRDRSVSIARAFAARDRRFVVQPAAEPAGLVPTLNRGLRTCRGHWVARMDADDLMHRSRLGEQLALLERMPALAGAGCHVRLFPRATLALGLRRYESWLNGIDGSTRVARDAFIECPLAHPTWMVRRDVLQRFGYRDQGWPEDYDLLLRLREAGLSMGVLPRRRLSWRNTAGRLSLTAPAYGIDRFVECKAEFLSRGFLAAEEQFALWGYGGTARTLCRALARRNRSPAVIVEVHPGRVGNRILGAPVIAPEELLGQPRRPLLVSVAGPVARETIRRFLDLRRFREGSDYLVTA